jgi:hypothetical protein
MARRWDVASKNSIRGSDGGKTFPLAPAIEGAERSCLHYVAVPSPIRRDFCLDSHAAGNNFGSLNRPSHARDFVSKRNGRDLDRPTVHETSEPQPLRAVRCAHIG